ncbi:sugar phosphate isomerase/epimerase family protein [Arthrobacter cryoconiti]|uniref:Sugar phosphate isomerase/epimerase family protein n=1 Tax=Arthrobacter cryoconiti TaxID=748907 RepID=A0ABV8R4W5_9MICC|nr:sugar phosphate isomerase/epimerase family protein [Arthrobacter cryoconiti]MCC9066815.1 sugar phosphate isomerase/epimerase [Arthrobacter cryoconiti]
MPLAFSTLGCPGLSLENVIALAHASGVTGLELRVAAGESVYPGMSGEQARAVARTLSQAGLVVLALASYVRVCQPDPEGRDGEVDAELRDAVELAAALGSRYVRVFPGAGIIPTLKEEPNPAMLSADKLGGLRLNRAAAQATELGVTLLLETHDSHPRGQDIMRILGHVDTGAPVQVIWDLMHPWRHDEAPGRTAQLLAGSLAYSQFKDGIRKAETYDVTLTLPGEGELPLRAMRDLVFGIAASHGTVDPWISLEWERAWHPELPPLADAIAALRAVLA